MVHFLSNGQEGGASSAEGQPIKLGRIDMAAIEGALPSSEDTMVCVCGPPAMVAGLAGPKADDGGQGEVGGALAELGYAADKVYKF